MRRHILLFAAPVALAVFVLAQSSGQKSSDKQSKQQPDPAPAPLFGGQIGVRSSQSTKESATLGFNGIDPSGKVEKKMLGTTPGAKDAAQVRDMDAARPTKAELAAFLKQGGLKSK